MNKRIASIDVLRGKPLCKCLSETGQNPMIAYTISGFIILPLINLLLGVIPGGNDWLYTLTAGRPLVGFLYGALLTCLMMADWQPAETPLETGVSQEADVNRCRIHAGRILATSDSPERRVSVVVETS